MITSYEYIAPKSDAWHFCKVELSPISLLVGLSGSGKTRFMNTLFNIASTVASGEARGALVRRGHWKMNVHVDDIDYYWEYSAAMDEDTPKISFELVTITINGETKTLVERNNGTFIFNNIELPKLNDRVVSINLLKEEKLIEPLYRFFARGLRREFSKDAFEKVRYTDNINETFVAEFKNKSNLDTLLPLDLTVNSKLYLFQEYFKDKYSIVIDFYKDVFPTIKNVKIEIKQTVPKSITPFFMVKEKGVRKWLPLSELSSGMQKVMLIMTDVLSLPGNGIYMIDEYENSLGINSIDFLPEFLTDHGGNNQFIITTHHPYLINNMPIKNWIVLNRKGSKVRFKTGKELEERYGKSKQQAFIKLINDPFYREGIK